MVVAGGGIKMGGHGIESRLARVAAGVFVCIAAGALSGIAVATSSETTTSAVFYCPSGIEVVNAIYCPPTTAAIPPVEPGIPNVLLCSPTLVRRADGTLGTAFQVEFREWKKRASYIPAGAAPANFAQGIGLICDNLPHHEFAGYLVDGEGTYYGPLLTRFVEGAVYPYWLRR